MREYDFLIIGAGLFGSVFAHEATKHGKKCLIIDKRSHIGGNTYCKEMDGINVHYYGAHIFHTNDKNIWDFVNSFVEFNRYTNSPIAISNGKAYNLPFNMNTFYALWGVTKPEEAQKIIQDQVAKFGSNDPQNLEEQALSLVGKDIYEILIKEYTEKQWGRNAKNLPSFIIKRVPLRYNFDNNYFNDKYQGIPIGGYNKLNEGLLKGIDIRLESDYFSDRKYFDSLADKIIFTGKIDEYYNFKFGELEYRSLRFEHESLQIENYQGNAVVNYIDKNIPYTRILEHKHFEFGKQKTTVITKEYPIEGGKNNEPYYPVNDEKNNKLFKQYEKLSQADSNVIFGGRLAEYKYYDMHQVIGAALSVTKNMFNK